ncbi:hypothetical protein AWB66_06013 [Caballeronia telluris]|uniref:Uncharacterized protein n=2 Tax=Caballeronia telluris TaxID=326475 RepID=A0A158KEP0_9BURK|nr:hypothetical protein AWB66_06013 [Caballeronia telluris]
MIRAPENHRMKASGLRSECSPRVRARELDVGDDFLGYIVDLVDALAAVGEDNRGGVDATASLLKALLEASIVNAIRWTSEVRPNRDAWLVP